jgi:hypothetical protein
MRIPFPWLSLDTGRPSWWDTSPFSNPFLIPAASSCMTAIWSSIWSTTH